MIFVLSTRALLLLSRFTLAVRSFNGNQVTRDREATTLCARREDLVPRAAPGS